MFDSPQLDRVDTAIIEHQHELAMMPGGGSLRDKPGVQSTGSFYMAAAEGLSPSPGTDCWDGGMAYAPD